jgi:hypothetical protein
MSKSAKSAKAHWPRSDSQADPEISRPGHKHRPSDKIAAQCKLVVIHSSKF